MKRGLGRSFVIAAIGLAGTASPAAAAPVTPSGWAITPAGHETVVMPGRPIAIVSNLLFEYRPAPPPRR